MVITPLMATVGASLLLNIVLIVWFLMTEKRLRKLFRGKSGEALEDVISIMVDKIKALEKIQSETKSELDIVHGKARRSIQGVETLRFKPFADAGSNQSFAIALLNEHKDGVIISSLYTRERMSVFAKPVKKGIPEFDLTDEEKEALVKAGKLS
jgi:hypothetical protein